MQNQTRRRVNITL